MDVQLNKWWSGKIKKSLSSYSDEDSLMRRKERFSTSCFPTALRLWKRIAVRDERNSSSSWRGCCPATCQTLKNSNIWWYKVVLMWCFLPANMRQREKLGWSSHFFRSRKNPETKQWKFFFMIENCSVHNLLLYLEKLKSLWLSFSYWISISSEPRRLATEIAFSSTL